jgi:hypothetical protein
MWIHVPSISRNVDYTQYTPKQHQKTDMVFLERDIKARKHAFGIQIYDILSMNNAATSASEIQKAFDECQRDISNLEAKVSTKREEMEAIDRHNNVGGGAAAASSNARGNTEMEFGVSETS